jgi:hypothetical protein
MGYNRSRPHVSHWQGTAPHVRHFSKSYREVHTDKHAQDASSRHGGKIICTLSRTKAKNHCRRRRSFLRSESMQSDPHLHMESMDGWLNSRKDGRPALYLATLEEPPGKTYGREGWMATDDGTYHGRLAARLERTSNRSRLRYFRARPAKEFQGKAPKKNIGHWEKSRNLRSGDLSTESSDHQQGSEAPGGRQEGQADKERCGSTSSVGGLPLAI